MFLLIKKIKNPYIVSTLVHLIVVLILIITVNSNSRYLKFHRIEQSIQVKMVAMPKFTLHELQLNNANINNSNNSNNSLDVDKNNNVVKILNKDKKIDFKKLINTFKDKITIADKTRKKTKNISSRPTKHINNYKLHNSLKKLLYAGNIIKSGSSNIGSGNAKASEINDYALKLPALIKPYWSLPSYLISKNLRCVIQLFIARDGTLISYSILKSSNNKNFDQNAVLALRSVAKFPTPSKNIVEGVKSGRVVLGFPL